MASVKPKLQGYVREDLFTKFEDERRSLGLSQSQALEKILLERYQGPDTSRPDRESLYWITKSLEDLQARVEKLEITGNPESNLESDSLSNPPINLDSNPESNLESDSLSNPPINLESNPPSNLESDSLSNPPINLESNPPSNLESDSLKFVICEFDKEVKAYRYWAGAADGFSTLLANAKRYKTKNMMNRTIETIVADANYSYFDEENDRFELQHNTVEFYVKNPTYKPVFT